jgi:hypothetical protein
VWEDAGNSRPETHGRSTTKCIENGLIKEVTEYLDTQLPSR